MTFVTRQSCILLTAVMVSAEMVNVSSAPTLAMPVPSLNERGCNANYMIFIITCTVSLYCRFVHFCGYNNGCLGVNGNTGRVINCFRAFSFYKGILPPILAETPKRATKFFTFEQYKKLFLFGADSPTFLVRTWYSIDCIQLHLIQYNTTVFDTIHYNCIRRNTKAFDAVPYSCICNSIRLSKEVQKKPRSQEKARKPEPQTECLQ